MNKFWYLTKVSFLKKIKNKTFYIVNILLLFLIIGLININSIINFFGGDFEEINNIKIYDKTNQSYNYIKEYLQKVEESANVEKISKYSKKYIKDDNDIVIIVNDSNDLKVKLITYGYINKTLYTNIQNALNAAKQKKFVKQLNISESELSYLNSNVNIEREYIRKDKSQKEETKQMLMNIIFPLLAFPFFTLTILVIQLIGAEINEEKSTKSMEYIISNVNPKMHFFSKILSVNIFAIMQSVLVLFYTFIGLLISKNAPPKIIEVTDLMYDKLPITIILTIILLFVTLLCYSLLSGILASVTTNMEDFQQLQTPIIIISLISFYLAIMSNMFDGSNFIKVFSYVPFTSAILSPCLFISGVTKLKDIIFSIIIMIFTSYLLIKYGIRIYKKGILNYSSTNLWKKIIKSIKNN